MAHRKITDRFGHEWDVWEVNPMANDRQAVNAGFVGRINENLREGWIAFQSAHEKRRLTPVPPEWDALTDAELLALLEVATKAGKPTRLIE